MKALSGKALARLLEEAGWTPCRVPGSHHIYGRPGRVVRLSVPIRGNKPLKVGP